ncbi:Hypothetical protein GLP15_1190 [Giardia lamblia P15]|uniref:Uncharacterized protein n=1 Tax=Giardia intestinalis (strain P15) TaxID=658858 RepID=E1F1E7_GIAIA|nr:Hypothetical protein GLP15_1190 [Giardia lamblia P15]
MSSEMPSSMSADLETVETEFETKLEQFVMGLNRDTEDLQQASFLVRASGYEHKLPLVFSRKVCALALQLKEKKLGNAREIILQFLKNVVISSTYIPRLEHAALGYLERCISSLGIYVHSAKEAIVQLLIDVLLGVYNLPGKSPYDLMICRIPHKVAWGIVGAISMIPFETDDDMSALATGIRLSLQSCKKGTPLTKTQLNQLVMLFRISLEVENLFKMQSAFYCSPTIFSQVYGDIFFSAQKDPLVRLVQDDVTAIQGYVELLVIPSTNIAHLVHLCREISLASVPDEELPNLVRNRSTDQELDCTTLSALCAFYKQVIFSGSQVGKKLLENIQSIANKQLAKGPLYEFLSPVADIHSILPLLFLNNSSAFLINMVELSLSLAYRNMLHVLHDSVSDQNGLSSAEASAGQLIGLLVQATIQLKGSFVIECAEAKQLTERCSERVGKVLAIIFEQCQRHKESGGPVRVYALQTLYGQADMIAFMLGTEIDLLEALKLLCKDNMLAADKLIQCIQELRLCYRAMIDDNSTNDTPLSLVCPYLTLVRHKNESSTGDFPMICYNLLTSNTILGISTLYTARMDEVFRGRSVLVDTGSRVVFEYALNSFSVNISTYTIVMLLLLFLQSADFEPPLRFNKFVSKFFASFAMESTFSSRVLITRLILGLTFDVPFICLSKTGYSVSPQQVDYTDGFITSFTDISGILNCSTISEIGIRGDSIDRLATLFVYANPYVTDVLRILVEQGFDLYDPEKHLINMYFPEYISQSNPCSSVGIQSQRNGDSFADIHTLQTRKYLVQHHLSLKAVIVQCVKRSKSSLLEMYGEISRKWSIELDTLKMILGELVDTGVLEMDEQGLYVFEI